MLKRLTFEGDFCDIAQCKAIPCPYNKSCSQKQVWERLKMYEDKIPLDEVEESGGGHNAKSTNSGR